MSTGIRVKGMERILRRLDQKVEQIPNATQGGLIKAGLLIQAAAQRKVPVDTGNLKASAFTVWKTGGNTSASFRGEDSGRLSSQHTALVTSTKSAMPRIKDKPTVTIGFSAFYALYVHEDMEAYHRVGMAKFLQRAVHENLPAIVATIRKEAKKGI